MSCYVHKLVANHCCSQLELMSHNMGSRDHKMLGVQVVTSREQRRYVASEAV